MPAWETASSGAGIQLHQVCTGICEVDVLWMLLLCSTCQNDVCCEQHYQFAQLPLYAHLLFAP